MVLLYHPDSDEPVDCHPGQVEHMKNNGWSDEAPKGKSKKPSQPKPTDEDN